MSLTTLLYPWSRYAAAACIDREILYFRSKPRLFEICSHVLTFPFRKVRGTLVELRACKHCISTRLGKKEISPRE